MLRIKILSPDPSVPNELFMPGSEAETSELTERQAQTRSALAEPSGACSAGLRP